ncbi:MAG: hypothetical protein LBN74_05655 [Prevotella sp.]|jgi:hypothetical protein|nr:hypothetical protein [Prevotella sp.]
MMNKITFDDQLRDQAVSLIKKRENPERVKIFLIERGLNEEDAFLMLNDIITLVNKDNLRTAKRNIFFGCLICAVGAFVTIAVHNVFPSLLILAGIAQLIIGLTQIPKDKFE